MSAIQERKPSFFIQFAGQGVKYMEELRRLYSSCPDIRPFIREAADAIKEQAALYDDSRSRFFSQGLDVLDWIERPETTPDLGYLMSSPLSHPLIYLCQISTYISIVQEGLDQSKLLGRSRGATGFSTGVAAAMMVSMDLPLSELWSLALKVQTMFFWQGIRTQQSMLNFGIAPRLEEELLNSGEGSPSCMASINNLSEERFEEAVEAFSAYGIAHPAYKLLPERRIVGGLPQTLTAFKHFLENRDKEAEWKYIPSTIAAHCPFLSYALETSPEDATRLGLEFKSEDIKIPVWANDTGEDLRLADDIIFSMMKAYFIRCASWRKQIGSLLQPDAVDYVLDFGPGAGVATLTENHISASAAQVIRCSVPLGRMMLFKKILPLLE